MSLILASASPRRRQLLEQVGLSFAVQVSNVAETVPPGQSPAELAISLAAAKALAVAGSAGGSVIIGADTIVVYNGEVFGKPTDISQARQMLTALNGKRHQVITGVAVVKDGETHTDCAVTAVFFRELTDLEINSYLRSGEWVDKAGAYGIQGLGALLVEKIDGCYSNVVGLPLVTLARLLKKAGVQVL